MEWWMSAGIRFGSIVSAARVMNESKVQRRWDEMLAAASDPH